MSSILRRSHNLLLFAIIEINLMILIPKMPEPIPLRTRLGIQRQNIIIDRPRSFVINMLMELLSAETGHFRHVHRPICRDPYSVNYLFRCGECCFWGETVE